jgi:ADP-ribose pyrophosphatase
VADLFFFGTLCHRPLLHAVLGRDAVAVAAVLDGYAVSWVQGQAFPMIAPKQGAAATGVLVRALDDADLARLDFYAGGYSVQKREVVVTTDVGVDPAIVYVPDSSVWVAGGLGRLPIGHRYGVKPLPPRPVM